MATKKKAPVKKGKYQQNLLLKKLLNLLLKNRLKKPPLKNLYLKSRLKKLQNPQLKKLSLKSRLKKLSLKSRLKKLQNPFLKPL